MIRHTNACWRTSVRSSLLWQTIGLGCVSLLVCTLWGCRGSDTDAAATASGEAAGTEASAAGPADDDQVAEIPEGTAEELFDFMAKMEVEALGAEDAPEAGGAGENNSSATAEKDAAAVATDEGPKLRRLMRTRVAACDKILSKEVPEETRIRALGVKLDALRTLAALDPEDVGPSFESFVKQLIESGNPLMARMAKSTQFQARVYNVVTVGKESTDVLLEDLKKLLAEKDAGPETLDASRDAMGWLFQQGNVEASAAGFRLIGERFQDHPDANLAAEGKSLRSQAVGIQFTQQSRFVMEKKEGAIAQLMEMLQEQLDAQPPVQDILGFTTQTAQFLEFIGQPKESLEAYEKIFARFASSTEETVGPIVKRTVELARRRLNLIGQPLRLDGVTLGGEVFDWSTYRGKWVLVVFWTTWQTGVTEEIEAIREAARAHQDPQLEVVLINLDDDRNALERYLKEHPIGWKILVHPDPNAAGFENPNATLCGVEAVPFVMLVNPQQDVVDIHVMGNRLNEVLKEKLGAK